MKVSQIIFSPTGGTERVADAITNTWGLPVNKIDLSNAETDYSSLSFEKDDIALIAAPSFGGRVPSLATQRISNIHGSHTPCVIVCVYGNRAYEDTLIELSGFAKKISEKINNNLTSLSTPQIPGNRPYKKAAGIGLVPKADNNCTDCGLCARQCPAQAISKENPKVTDSKKCISCMRCVVQCPQSSRKVNGAMVSVAALAMKKACSTRKGNELYI